MNPRTLVDELRNGSRKAETWVQYCETNGIGDWALLGELDEARS